MTAAAKALPQITVADAARRAIEGATSNEDAARRLLEEAKRVPELYRKIIEPYELSACMSAIAQVRLDERSAIWKAPQAAPKSNTSVRALARANSYTLLDFPLPKGIRLGDACADDVREAMTFYRKQATDMSQKAEWLGLIAEKLKGRKRVSQVFSAQELEGLQAQALS